MPDTKNIHTALLEFQKKQVSVKKNGVNPAFKSKYVTLNDVLEAVKEPLNEVGVVIHQLPQENGLTTVLMHAESETMIESFLPYIDKTNAQKLGSNNTYNRRYALVTMLGLEDEDDDGAAASRPTSPHSSPPRPVQKTVGVSEYEKRESETLEDGPHTITVKDIKHSAPGAPKAWEMIVTTDGQKAFNNSEAELFVGATYDVVIERKGIVSVEEDLTKYL